MPTRSFTERPRFARFYRRVGPAMERGGLADQRRRALARLEGVVLEVGAGDGRNLPHYPAEVTRVIALEPEPLLRETARRLAADVAVPVDVVDGVAESLDLDDGSVDAAVVTLVLCSVADPHRALRELHRVVRPGGQLRFLEHVRADGALAATVQRLADATLWPVLNGGCHTARPTAAAISAAGFRIDEVERLGFRDTSLPFPTSPQLLGTARRRP